MYGCIVFAALIYSRRLASSRVHGQRLNEPIGWRWRDPRIHYCDLSRSTKRLNFVLNIRCDDDLCRLKFEPLTFKSDHVKKRRVQR